MQKKFNVTNYAGFMSHNPVSREEVELSVRPKENDWRWYFDAGYLHAPWNFAIIARVIPDAIIEYHARYPSRSDDPDPDHKWLEQQALDQMKRAHDEWARLKPRAIKAGRIETKEEAVTRVVAFKEARGERNTSTSSKNRVMFKNDWYMIESDEDSRNMQIVYGRSASPSKPR